MLQYKNEVSRSPGIIYTKRRMPKRAKTTYAAKRVYKKKFKVDQAVPYTMYKGIIPRSIMVPLRYTELVQFSEAVTGTSANVYRANSIFDPNFTGAGHQPLGHDQWANFYLNYRVHKCTIDVNFAQNQSTVQVLCSVVPSENTTTLTAASEMPGAKSILLAQDTAGPNVGRIRMTMDMQKYDGDRGAFASDEMSAAFGSNPAEIKCFHVVLQNAAGGASVDATCFTQIDYWVELFNQAPLSGS